ncbi:MAG: glycosyltransferase family 4 protein [Bacteroidales bacterium]|nr:glycosyltransferase family 4 protein [Bacteroidales bacterium]
MKAIFVHFYDFSLHSGISKKILYQVDALRACGMDVELCYMDIDENGYQKRMSGDKVIENYGNGFSAKFLKWFRFGALTDYILENNIKFVYIRSFYNINPYLLKMLRRLRKAGVRVVMEFPTYPYDYEVKGGPLKYRLIFLLNRIFRNRLKDHLDRIITFTDYPAIHGVKTICISNGIDFNNIKLKSQKNEIKNRLNLIGVAEIHFWHGFDRIIKGIGEYYKKKRDIEVHFFIVGDGAPEDLNLLIQLSKQFNVENYIHFLGNRYGEELDSLFEQSDFGIASLARHRSNITKIKTLKTREYAARGIPFIYSEIDDDFENMPYILKAPADETPIDIDRIVSFSKSLKLSPSDIRNSIINSLSWKIQMQKIIDEIFN